MKYLVNEIELSKDFVILELKDSNFDVKKIKIHAVAFANNYLSKGISINQEKLDEIILDSEYYFIKDLVIKKLKRKDFSKKEIINFVSDKLNDEQIGKLINDLEKNNYINDYNYVKLIFNEAENKLKGSLFILEKLKEKEIAENIVNAFFEHFNEENIANKLVNHEVKILMNKHPKNALINKIAYKLNNNGFKEDIINNQIEKLQYITGSNDHDLIMRDYLKLNRKYQGKYEKAQLSRKIIESLMIKGYNYKSIMDVIKGANEDD